MWKMITKPQIRRWTKTAIECFKRGCICEGCYYNTFFSDKTQHCHMKEAVIETVKVLGSPPNIKEKTIVKEEQ